MARLVKEPQLRLSLAPLFCPDNVALLQAIVPAGTSLGG